ncbi:MAG: CoA-binding protein [Deltaproteobacteria bacterium]|nr:CoA-binding protein [Deltaproteobacteria bacterium]
MIKFLEPESIAVIGASSDPRKGGYALFSNLKGSFSKRLYAVNPGGGEVCGLKALRSADELPEGVDLAVVFVRAPLVPEILEACGKRAIRRVMIQSAGFSEVGSEGVALQERCLAIARGLGMRIWGPNCMGVVNGSTGMVASFVRPEIWEGHLKPGPVSLVVQSGMLSAGFLFQILREGYFGLSKACSIGNKGDVNECDFLEYFAGDETTEVVGMYLESIADAARFRNALSGLKKPVVVLKGGISRQGAQAAKSHTASLSGNALLADGFFRQTGVYRATDFFEMVDLIRALVLWRGKIGGPRIGVLTFSGASGIVAADHLDRRGMTLAHLSEDTIRTLRTVFPEWMEPMNPVDLWPAIERVGRRAYIVAVQALLKDPGVDGLYVHVYVDEAFLGDIVEALESLRYADKPVAVWAIGDTRCFPALRSHVEPLGAPVFGEVARGVLALSLALGPRPRPN